MSFFRRRQFGVYYPGCRQGTTLRSCRCKSVRLIPTNFRKGQAQQFNHDLRLELYSGNTFEKDDSLQFFFLA